MIGDEIMTSDVKPFLKWAGGKSQLLNEIRKYYPFNNKYITKYAEPGLFVFLAEKPSSSYIVTSLSDMFSNFVFMYCLHISI